MIKLKSFLFFLVFIMLPPYTRIIAYTFYFFKTHFVIFFLFLKLFFKNPLIFMLIYIIIIQTFFLRSLLC